YEFASVLSKGQARIIKVDAAFRAREDSIMLANDMKVAGENSPSLWGQIAVLRRTEYNFEHFRKNKEELKKLVDLRREMLEHPGLQANLDRLYAKELERQTLTYSLPDTEATHILRRMTDKYRGKYLLIDFWGMGCGPCRSAIEHSKELRKTFRDHPEVDFLFIAAPESTEEAYNNYVKENLEGEDCHLITRDEYNKLMELFQFNGIPHYETLDKNGNVVREGLEYRLYDTNTFTEELKELKNRLE
ncbi:MAG: thioredoxin family protein, partial [Bacteroidaceae bacterium]|nr:thioredoxin family protein [Bacteroidaceae bacterium]